MNNELIYYKDGQNTELIGVGQFHGIYFSDTVNWKSVDDFISTTSRTIFCALSYELKNQLFELPSVNMDSSLFPYLSLFIPSSLYKKENDQFILIEGEESDENLSMALDFLAENGAPIQQSDAWQPLISRDKYISTVQSLIQAISKGELYELNYCQSFLLNTKNFNSCATFNSIQHTAKAPFARFWKTTDFDVLCWSPERYIKKEGNTLITQPIKGTAPRGKSTAEDEQYKKELLTSKKNRTENVMIVDLVRNDLSKIAQKGSVHVDELFGIYSFEAVHQMISTVSCVIRPEIQFSDIIKATFPMGSMTGAPKLAAINYAEQHEVSSRNLYSGSIGVIYPNKDFDFNVVIRSMIYDKTKEQLNCSVGGAITLSSNPEEEYEECLTKVGQLMHRING